MTALRNLYLFFLLSIVIVSCIQMSDDRPVKHQHTSTEYTTNTQNAVSQQGGAEVVPNTLQGILKKAILPIFCQWKNQEHILLFPLSLNKHFKTERSPRLAEQARDFVCKNITFVRFSDSSYLYLLQKIVV